MRPVKVAGVAVMTPTVHPLDHRPQRAVAPGEALRPDPQQLLELEVFAANGQTVAVVSVPASAVREATEHEVLSVRELARA